MQYNAVPLQKLIEQFERMPGIGRKTAQRIAFYILGLDASESKAIADAIITACDSIHKCSVCSNLTDDVLCPICKNTKRDHSVICVVEDSQSLIAIEKTKEFNGVYHVLHGAISPLDGIGPDRLTIKELLARFNNEDIKEIIIAFPTLSCLPQARWPWVREQNTWPQGSSGFSKHSGNGLSRIRPFNYTEPPQ